MLLEGRRGLDVKKNKNKKKIQIRMKFGPPRKSKMKPVNKKHFLFCETKTQRNNCFYFIIAKKYKIVYKNIKIHLDVNFQVVPQSGGGNSIYNRQTFHLSPYTKSALRWTQWHQNVA